MSKTKSTERPCRMCGYTWSLESLVPIAWIGGRLVIAEPRDEPNVFICTNCVRGIKAIPFGDVHKAEQ